MHLWQPASTYSACWWFTKNKGRIQKIKETGDWRYIFQNKLDKACFLHDLAYVDFKDLSRTTVSNKVLHDKAFNIAKNSKYDGYQCEIASVVYKCFNKKSSGSGVKSEIMANWEWTEELHKPIIRADLMDMNLISKFCKRFRFLLCYQYL